MTTKKKLKNDLTAAANIASKMDRRDSGPINYDGPVVSIPGLKAATVIQAAAEAGMSAYPFQDAEHMYIIDWHPQAQSSLRSELAMTFATEMEARGYEASTLLSLGILCSELIVSDAKKNTDMRTDTSVCLPLQIVRALEDNSLSSDGVSSELTDKIKTAYNVNPQFREHLTQNGYKDYTDAGIGAVNAFLLDLKELLRVINNHITNDDPYFNDAILKYSAWVHNTYISFLAGL